MDEFLNEVLKDFVAEDSSVMIWLMVGFVGQMAFSSRFLVQWIASERAGESVIPVSFWILSIVGNVCLLAYAIWRRDPVFILGQSLNSIVYTRNLMLIAKARARESEA